MRPLMNRHITLVRTIFTLLVVAGAPAVPALAAVKSPAMAACSAEWGKMKEAKTIPDGQTWPKFWSQCAKDYAAAHGTGAASTDEATTAPSTTKKTKRAAVNEDEPTG